MPKIKRTRKIERTEIKYHVYTYLPFTDAFPDLRQSELILLSFISSMNQKVGCIAKVGYICRALRISPSTLWRCEQELLKKGLIIKIKTSKGKRCWKSKFVFVHSSSSATEPPSHRNGHFPKRNGLKLYDDDDDDDDDMLLL